MVDRKLSEFETIEKANDIKFAVLYNDGQRTLNGKLPITELDNVYATKTELEEKAVFNLFDHKWSDYELNDQSWIKADTFSWQSGAVYTAAYNHLIDDYNNGEKLYGWGDSNYWVATTSPSPSVGDNVYVGVPSIILGTVSAISSGSITVNGTTFVRYTDGDGGFFDLVRSYSIRYILASDGHKITTDETNAANIYNESGVAWYYIIDTANQRFKLPRENPAREELIQVVRAKGSGICLGLTDGTNYAGIARSSNVGSDTRTIIYGEPTGTNYTGTNNLQAGCALGITDDPMKSGIISDMTESTSVYKGNKYLYFYVGNFTQTATEQTAGLNSELFNGKVDLDLNNMNPSATAKETIVGWGIPDYSAAVTISVPTSSSPYTAPKAGVYFLSYGNSSSVDGKYLLVNNEKVYRYQYTSAGNPGYNCIIPVDAGDVISSDTTNIPSNVLFSTFCPLKGVQNA